MNKLNEKYKIFNEINSKSGYQQDLENYNSIGFATGFINCMNYIEKDKREIIIEGVKEQYESEKDNKQLEYILRIYKDEFK